MCLSIQAFTQLKMARFWFFMMALHAVFIFLSVTASDHDKFSPISEDTVTATTSSRELTFQERKINQDNMKLDDYSPIDPPPGSSAAVTTGPIEHGTPLMPHIPKVAPPYPPINVGSPSASPPA